MATAPHTHIIPVQSLISSTSLLHNDSHIWLIDSAAFSHISGNLPLFFDMVTITPVRIQTASGDSFTTNQSESICIRIKSNPTFELPNLHITLTDVIYVPSLCANLLSVGHMTSANVNVMFSKNHSALTLNGQIITRGPPKVDNLFIYTSGDRCRHDKVLSIHQHEVSMAICTLDFNRDFPFRLRIHWCCFLLIL